MVMITSGWPERGNPDSLYVASAGNLAERGKSYVRAARSSRPSDSVAIRRAVVKQMKFEREFMSAI